MMPPDRPQPPLPGRRVHPYPNEALALGGGRWLEQTGEVVTTLEGDECELKAVTLAYWEDAAVRGGHILSELIG